MKKINKILFYFIFIFIFSLCVYFPSFRASFQLDDVRIIEKNPVIRSFDVERVWAFDPTRFLVHLSFAANYWMDGLDVRGYHFVNLLLHMCAGVGVFFFCRELFRMESCKKRGPFFSSWMLALGAAAIFLVHPIQTSAVTYAVQRATVLASLFYIFSLFGYLYFRKTKKGVFYGLSLFAAFLGAFCKPIIITLPLSLLALEFIILRKEEDHAIRAVKKSFRRWPFSQEMKFLLPYFLLWILIPGLLMLYAHQMHLWQISRQTDLISRPTYLCTQFNVVIKYIRLLFLPLNQNLDYDYPLSTSIMEFPTILSFLLVLLLIGGAFFSRKRNPLLSFAISFFFIALSLESSIFPLSDVIFEHRLYLPLLGFVLLLPECARLLKSSKVFTVFLIGMICGYGFLTYRRNLLWADSLRFLEDVAQKSPRKARPQVSLGIAYMNQGALARAEESFVRAIQNDPQYVKAYLALGTVYHRMGDPEMALMFFEKAINLDPGQDEAFNNAGVIVARQGDLTEAFKYFDYAIELNPLNLEAYNNRARIFEGQGNDISAINDYTRAIEIDPTDAFMYLNRARVYLRTGKKQLAERDMRKAEALRGE